MRELADFVRARIAEDRSFVDLLHDEPVRDRDLWLADSVVGGGLHAAISAARLRVELESKHRLVTWALEHDEPGVLLCLALPWDDHADWREAWRTGCRAGGSDPGR